MTATSETDKGEIDESEHSKNKTRMKICLTLLHHAVTLPWHTSSTLVACIVLTLNLIWYSPAAAPGSLSCSAPPSTSPLPPKTSGSPLSLWRMQARSLIVTN